jgi:hypothetical protein
MSLIYRGIAYDRTNYTIEAKVKKLTGKYRGNAYQIPQLQPKIYKNNAFTLKYRGIEYGLGSSALEVCLESAFIPSFTQKIIEA